MKVHIQAEAACAEKKAPRCPMCRAGWEFRLWELGVWMRLIETAEPKGASFHVRVRCATQNATAVSICYIFSYEARNMELFSTWLNHCLHFYHASS